MTVAALCPYCARDLSTVPEGTSRDHVIPQALGGTAVVPACRPCNSDIGSRVEGRLLGPTALLAMNRSAAGLGGAALRGVDAETGAAMLVDLGSGKSSPAHPEVQLTREGGFLNRRIGGSEEQVREVLAGLRRKGARLPPDDVLLAAAERTTQPPLVQMQLTLDLKLAQRFVAKVALGTGHLLWGDGFGDTPLAIRLREILHSERGGWDPDGISAKPEMLDVMFDLLTSQGLPDRRVPPFRLGGPNVSQLTFLPLRPGATVVMLHLLGGPFPPHGLVIDGEPSPPIELPCGLTETVGSPPELWCSEDDFLKLHAPPEP